MQPSFAHLSSMRLLSYLLLIASITACQQESPEQLLIRAQQILANSQSIAYDRQDIWDNRFINSIDTFSSSSLFSKNTASPLGYDLHLMSGQFESVLIENQYWDIYHDNNQIVAYTPEETAEEFSNPEYFTPVAKSPQKLLHDEGWGFQKDTALGECMVSEFLIREEDELDDGRQRIIENLLSIDQKSGLLLRYQSTIYIAGEFTQAISVYYHDYALDSIQTPFSYELPLDYSQLSLTDYEAYQSAEGLIEGTLAPNFKSLDINDQEVELAQLHGKRVLLNFSFIGCGGCEAAMRDFNASTFKWPEELKPIYLSHANDSEEISHYYADKGMPFSTVIPEAASIRKDYGVYFFPTFFLINEKGIIEEIIEGYDEDFIASLK